ncbi:MAG: hypothetical protein AB1758_34710 [Candidatus Eremiobacterota bacterium]
MLEEESRYELPERPPLDGPRRRALAACGAWLALLWVVVLGALHEEGTWWWLLAWPVVTLLSAILVHFRFRRLPSARVSLAAFTLLVPLGSVLHLTLLDSRSQGRLGRCIGNFKDVCTALEMYSCDHGQYPMKLSWLTPEYLRRIPVCPEAGRDTYTNSYTWAWARSHDRRIVGIYTVYCEGANHRRVRGVRPNYPQYTSSQGLIER